ncbi:MAG: DMT family transporter [Treponema sp.]|jgi:drug/metabolite transporter (DMT)-like permease|nr:DMT family transporter [Treponema sp.]
MSGIRGTAKEQRIAGQGAVLLCAVLWSTSGLFIKLVNWHPALIAGGRSALALGVLLLLRRLNRAPAVPLRHVPVLAASGLCNAATMILFVIANKLTASANAILLQYTAPVWACLLAWFLLREKPRWEHWIALCVVGGGMLLVFRGGLSGGSLLGDCLALVSGLTFGANSVVMRMHKDGSPADVMICSHLTTAAFSLPFFFLYPPQADAGNVCSILFMGVFQTGAASALFAYGIRRITAVQAMLLAAIEPVLNPVWVFLVTGERPVLSVITGGCIIIAAVVFSSLVGELRLRRNRPVLPY